MDLEDCPGLGFDPEQTLVLSRTDLKDENPDGSPEEQAITYYFKTLAEDPNLEAVAISAMKLGGLFNHFFVRNIGGDRQSTAIMPVIDRSFGQLEAAVGQPTGYGSYIFLGDRTFEDVESQFRVAHREDLELLGIVRFQ